MKKWNSPMISELNVNETANGFFCSNVEIVYLTHTHNGQKEEVKPGDNGTGSGDDNNSGTNTLS